MTLWSVTNWEGKEIENVKSHLVLKTAFCKTKHIFWDLLPQNLKIEIYVIFHNAVLGPGAFSNVVCFVRKC